MSRRHGWERTKRLYGGAYQLHATCGTHANLTLFPQTGHSQNRVTASASPALPPPPPPPPVSFVFFPGPPRLLRLGAACELSLGPRPFCCCWLGAAASIFENAFPRFSFPAGATAPNGSQEEDGGFADSRKAGGDGVDALLLLVDDDCFAAAAPCRSRANASSGAPSRASALPLEKGSQTTFSARAWRRLAFPPPALAVSGDAASTSTAAAAAAPAAGSSRLPGGLHFLTTGSSSNHEASPPGIQETLITA